MKIRMGSILKIQKVWSVPVVVIFLWGCSHPIEPDSPASDVVYFNSFESPKDTVGWSGYGGRAFVEDTPPNGGKQSMRISGGCIVPHAQTQFDGPTQDCYLTLQCWGKNLALGGGVSLYRLSDCSKSISISVSDTVWTFMRSDGTLFCPAGDRLVIEMMSGGIVYSAMLIDLLEVRKIN